MDLLPRLKTIMKRHEELASVLNEHGEPGSSDYIKLSQEFTELGPVVVHISAYLQALEDLHEAKALLIDTSVDADMKELAQEEYDTIKQKLPEFEQQMKLLLLPKDADDDRNAILEIRPGTGGDEAGLFAGDLLEMYKRFAAAEGWRFEPIAISDNDVGGLKEASVMVQGSGVLARMKFESGVHRVQRVPATESGGRIHTSAATVAVLPEVEDVDIDIRNEDLRIETMRAQGAGGQHVNTTDSAVRITHLPTGIVVSQQDEKSQHKNKAKAMKVLMARLYDFEKSRADAERAADRKSQLGSGDRSERIRTYNFPQGRVTDHRINLTVHKLDKILAGEALGEVVDALITQDQADRLAALES